MPGATKYAVALAVPGGQKVVLIPRLSRRDDFGMCPGSIFYPGNSKSVSPQSLEKNQKGFSRRPHGACFPRLRLAVFRRVEAAGSHHIEL